MVMAILQRKIFLDSKFGACRIVESLSILIAEDNLLKIQTKFWFDDANRRKNYVISALGRKCKDLKQRIWKNYKRNTLKKSLEARPLLIPLDQWTDFVFAQFTDKSKKQRERNTTNRSKLKMVHALGRKSLARKAYEMEEKTGVEPSRGELFIASRMRSDGSMICDEAKICAEKLKEAMNQQLPGESDAFAQVFGPEHSGRVRCIGRGPTPSKYFSSSDADMMKSQMQKIQAQNEEIVELKSQMLKYQVQNAETMQKFGEKLDIVSSALLKVIQENDKNIKMEQSNENGGNIEIAFALQILIESCRVNGGNLENILQQAISSDTKKNCVKKNGDKVHVGTQRLKRTSSSTSSVSGTNSISVNAQVGTQRHTKKLKSFVAQ